MKLFVDAKVKLQNVANIIWERLFGSNILKLIIRTYKPIDQKGAWSQQNVFETYVFNLLKKILKLINKK